MIGIKSLESVEYILQDDPAIDTQHKDYDWSAYWTDGDRKHVPIKDGCTPTVYRVKRLSRPQYLHVAGRPDHERSCEAVAWGLVAVENLKRNGKDVVLKHTKTDKGDRLTEESLEDVFAPALMGELGLRILSLTSLHPF